MRYAVQVRRITIFPLTQTVTINNAQAISSGSDLRSVPPRPLRTGQTILYHGRQEVIRGLPTLYIVPDKRL